MISNYIVDTVMKAKHMLRMNDNEWKDEKKALPTVFLDRDGVLCKEMSYVTKADELYVFPFSKACIEAFHSLGYLAIIVTNQSAVARGLVSEGEIQKMNVLLKSEIGVDDIYYCPHHPEGIVKKYSITCDCRKPKTGMITRALLEHDIDIEESWMVGDRSSDILLGQNAGLNTVLLESGYGTVRMEQQVEPDYVLDDLRDVVKLLKLKRNMDNGKDCYKR